VRLTIIKVVSLISSFFFIAFLVKWLISNFMFLAEYLTLSPAEIMAKQLRAVIDSIFIAPASNMFFSLNLTPPSGYYHVCLNKSYIAVYSSFRIQFAPTYYSAKLLSNASLCFYQEFTKEFPFAVINISKNEESIRIEAALHECVC